jgi:hypothetical protein
MMIKEYLRCPLCSQLTKEEQINKIGQAYCEDCDYRFFCMTINYDVLPLISGKEKGEFERKLKTQCKPFVIINSKQDLVGLRKFLLGQSEITLSELKKQIDRQDKKWYFKERSLHEADSLEEELKKYQLKLKTG